MDIVFGAFFTNNGAGASGLTVTIDVVTVALADLTEAQVVTAGSMTASPNINGLYLYRLAGADPTTHSYFARANTAGTVDQADLPAVANLVAADTQQIEGADPSDTINAAADTAISDAALASAADLATVAGYVDTEVAAILADTNELQADWANGGRLDLLLDAIKAVTDALPEGGALTTLLANITAILADTGTDGVVISQATREAIADALLGRGVDNVEATATVTTLAGLVLAAFESSIAGATWTINRTDGVTQFATRTVTTDAAADPVTGIS